MTYIDSCVQEAHSEVQGEPVGEQLLGELSQIHRSTDAADIFRKITGIGVGSKADLVVLFRRVKSEGYNLQAALRDECLKQYIRRTSPFNLN